MELVTLGIAILPFVACWQLRKRVECLEAAVATHDALPSGYSDPGLVVAELQSGEIKALRRAPDTRILDDMDQMSVHRLKAVQAYAGHVLRVRDRS